MPIVIKTPVYEGPMEVLLELIEKHKLLINDISLSAVTDEYIARVNAMHALPVGETAEFVALAATLLLIKSRSLLPNLQLSDDESRDIKELEYRLAVYQLLKEASHSLSALELPYLAEGVAREQEPLYIPDPSITPESLRAAAQTLIDGFPATLTLPKVAVKKILSLEEMIGTMAARIQSALRMSFKEFAGKKERGEIIVGFLALLELVKQGIIRAQQEAHFGDITLEADAVSTPSYGPKS
jgi:segregation and condensation protein A